MAVKTTQAEVGVDAGEVTEGVHQFIEKLQGTEKAALGAVKRFVDTVNDAFPDISEDGPRRQIIEAAFGMTEKIVEASNKLAVSLVDLTGSAIEGQAGSSS